MNRDNRMGQTPYTDFRILPCSADRIIVELNDLDAYDSMSLSEKEELCSPACPDFEASLKSIQALIGEFYLSAFHATRALSSDSFIVNGLRVLDDKRLRELADDIRISINHPQFSFEDYEIPENRKGKVWLALTDPAKEPSGFKEFMCCFGGEVLGEFLRGSGLDCDVIARIRSLGNPLCVECHIPINSIGNCKVAEIVKDMIKHALNVRGGSGKLNSWDKWIFCSESAILPEREEDYDETTETQSQPCI